MTTVQPEAPTASPAPTAQCDQIVSLSIASAAINGVQVPVARPTDQLTPDQVRDLPMGDLLAQVNGRVGTTEIEEPGFFGYVKIYPSGRITICTPASLDAGLRDLAIRYLIAVHRDLSLDLFPDIFQATRFGVDGEVLA
ncbi:hypothetical protein ABZ446_01885 [Streptomyces sp. NPDC005813]|uniref:hypothetical protein n=1 Tax=Streptomyces sp. NPDC005813 TaxID=3155592 RepID=UPI0033D2A917